MCVKKLISIGSLALMSMFFACEQATNNQKLGGGNTQKAIMIDHGTAKVHKVHGLYVFIEAEPAAEYESMGPVITNETAEKLAEAGKGKKFFEAVGDVFKEGVENMTFNDLLENMVQKARDTYPDADAVIFNQRLTQCEVIKFKQL